MDKIGFLTGSVYRINDDARAAVLDKLTDDVRASVSEDARVYEGVAFANEVARNNGDELSLDGLDLTDYRRNPVILVNHGRTNDGLPIGRAIKTEKTDGKLIVRYVLDEEDDYALRVAKLIDNGTLRGLSVGWRTIEATPIKAEDAGDPFAPHRITKSSLLDISTVGVPADADALNKERGYTMTRETIDYLFERVAGVSSKAPTATPDKPPAKEIDLTDVNRRIDDLRTTIDTIGGALGIEGFIGGGATVKPSEEITVEDARKVLEDLVNNTKGAKMPNTVIDNENRSIATMVLELEKRAKRGEEFDVEFGRKLDRLAAQVANRQAMDAGGDRIIGGVLDNFDADGVELAAGVAQVMAKKFGVSESEHKRLQDTCEENYRDLTGRDLYGKNKGGERVLTTTNTSSFISDKLGSVIWRRAQLASRVAGLIPPYRMTASNELFPLGLGDIVMYPTGEGVEATEVTPSSANVRIKAYKATFKVVTNSEVRYDSVIAFASELLTAIRRSMPKQIDRWLLSADNAVANNINQDTAGAPTGTNKQFQLGSGFAGLRKRALNAASQFDSTAIAKGDLKAEMLLDLLARLDDEAGANPSTVFVVPTRTFYRLLALDEVTKPGDYGSQATLLTGDLRRIYGKRIIVSPDFAMSKADGKISNVAANNNRGAILAFDPTQYRFGNYLPFELETDRNAGADQDVIVGRQRLGFAGRVDGTDGWDGTATDKAVAMITNIA